MIIEFQTIRFKNFLSVGNAFHEISLTGFKNNLIVGKVGQGKSTIFEAIFYCLFGKPYRDIKIGQLINSINNKLLVVECEFKIGPDLYKVVRGQKPSIFEIYKNSVLITEEASSRDYQKILEGQILKVNARTFKQIILIGAKNYQPFMMLSAKDRRQVTEDILDITIFSAMAQLAKDKYKVLDSEIKTLSSTIDFAKESAETQKNLVKSLQEDVQKKIDDRKEKISQLNEKIKNIDLEISNIEICEDSSLLVEKFNELNNGSKKLIRAISKLDATIEQQNELIQFFTGDSCPTCQQDIVESHKCKITDDANTLIETSNEKKISLEKTSEQFDSKITSISKQIKDIEGKEYSRKLLTNDRRNAETQLREASTIPKETSLELTKEVLRTTIEKLLESNDKKSKLQEELSYYAMSVSMLKDTGIKARIIKNFIPMMNASIEKYLQKFDMFVNFELNENFEETIKSRNRDIFTYNSFSGGESQKIDMALLFTFRDIASMKSSVNCNILMLDETLDKSLDSESVDATLDILNSIESNVNVFVITHREVPPELFDRVIRVEKKNDFTTIKEE